MLILGMGLTLLFAQTFKLHLHAQNVADAGVQVAEVHLALGMHAPAHLQTSDSSDKDHAHNVEINISADSFAAKIKLLNLFALLFVVLAILHCALSLCCVRILRTVDAMLASLHDFIQPPLRAPPHPDNT